MRHRGHAQIARPVRTQKHYPQASHCIRLHVRSVLSRHLHCLPGDSRKITGAKGYPWCHPVATAALFQFCISVLRAARFIAANKGPYNFSFHDILTHWKQALAMVGRAKLQSLSGRSLDHWSASDVSAWLGLRGCCMTCMPHGNNLCARSEVLPDEGLVLGYPWGRPRAIAAHRQCINARACQDWHCRPCQTQNIPLHS